MRDVTPSQLEARCIYCLASKPLADFNREHVIHRAFGGFEGALTLVAPSDAAVCAACNDYFGQSIDIALTRDSMEAVLRLDAGLKSPTEVDDLFARNVRFSLSPENEHGPMLLGLYPAEDGGAYRVAPIPQVRFPLRNGKARAVSEDVLERWDPRSDGAIDLKRGLAIFWPRQDESAYARLLALLGRYEIPFEPKRPLVIPGDSETIDYQTWVREDRFAARAIAKISFNYLAKVVSQTDKAFPFRSEFDAVRAFIRNDIGRPRDFVMSWDAPDSLVGAAASGRLSRHLLQLKWERRPSGHIIGLVRLFGVVAYTVLLARAPAGVWRDLWSAHHYDLVNKNVRRLSKGE